MGLFRRKSSEQDEPERCPVCREPVPEGAVECKMCGAALALEPVRSLEHGERAEGLSRR
jgi:hypothetical protein